VNVGVFSGGTACTLPVVELAVYPPTAVPCGCDQFELCRVMQLGSGCEAVSAICWPTTTDCVPETGVPARLMVGIETVGKFTETG